MAGLNTLGRPGFTDSTGVLPLMAFTSPGTVLLLAGGFRFDFPRLFRRMKLSWGSNEGWLLVLAAGGCLVGNLISYLVDPLNYMMGWKLLLNISRTASVVGSAGIRQWLSVTYHRLPEMIGVAVLLGLVFVLFVRRLKTISTVQILSFSLSICLFGAFFFSSWGVFVRYFVPSFISAVASLIIPSNVYMNSCL